MLLLLFAACKPDDPATYAGCTVTTFTTDHENDEDLKLVEVYDAAARVVERRLEHSGITETWTGTFEGDCLVEEGTTTVLRSETDLLTLRRTCDAHGHPERTEQESAPHAGEPYAGPIYTYVNEHDDEGRLVAVEEAMDGEPWSEATYTWEAPCQEAAETTFAHRGTTSIAAMTCRGDGQVERGDYVTVDEEGNTELTVTTERTYDALGRVLTEVWEGSEDVFDGTFTWEWEDLLAPGPTSRVLRRGADERLAREERYVYDCGP